ncbi:MAG: DnaJ domain-containing protein [Bdellovibrionota bacterium]
MVSFSLQRVIKALKTNLSAVASLFTRSKAEEQPRSLESFLTESAKLFGEIARIDGEINRAETEEFLSRFSDSFPEAKTEMTELLRTFKEESLVGRNLQERVSTFYWSHSYRKSDMPKLLEIALEIVIADGAKNAAEEHMLELVARTIGVHLKDFRKLESEVLRRYYVKKGYTTYDHSDTSDRRGKVRRETSERNHRSERALRSLSRNQHLKVLGLSSGATQVEIKAAYRRLVKESHPDVNRDSGERNIARFREIQSAYESLKRTSSFR